MRARAVSGGGGAGASIDQFGPTDRGRRARGWAGRATAAQAGAEEKRRAGLEKIERREGEKGFGPERIQLRN